MLFGVPADAADVPYVDPSSTGALSFCGADGSSLSGGTLTDGPFAVTTLASSATPSDYAVPGATATLYAYQPREALAPAQWSGELMTGASRYADVAHAAVKALPADLSLGGFVADFPPAWNGLVQLRVYVGAPGQPIRSGKYDSADVQVSGDSWTLLRGGHSSCAQVKATPLAQLLGVPVVTPTSTAVPKSGAAAGQVERNGTHATVLTSADHPAAITATTTATTASTTSWWQPALLVPPLIVLPLLGLGAVLSRRALRQKGTR